MSSPTSVRLDAFQRLALTRLSRYEQRSRSELISRAIDHYLAEAHHLSRSSYEHEIRTSRGRDLLASFTPRPFRIAEDPPLFEMPSEGTESTPSENAQNQPSKRRDPRSGTTTHSTSPLLREARVREPQVDRSSTR